MTFAAAAMLGSGVLAGQSFSPVVKNFVSVSDPAVVLQHVRVIDGTGAAPVEDQTIMIQGGRIQSVGSGASAALAGLDPTGYGGVLPGFGDQREVELLVQAGFSPV